jgi:phytoene/squalene synthetase
MTEPRMTYDRKQTLSGLLLEYQHSLDRMAGERDLLKTLESRALKECGVEPKAFRAVATAMWKDQVDKTLEELTEKCDLIELIRAEEETHA